MEEKAAQLRALAALFAPWGDGYRGAYEEARAVCGAQAPEVPTAAVRRRLEDDVLASGAPASALPVESLYRPWATGSEGAGDIPADFGSARHLFLGDSAQHMRELYRRLQLEVPKPFAAMPDHVALLAETLELFAQAGNAEAVSVMLEDHFDWLADYRKTLASRQGALAAQDGADLPRAEELARALDHGCDLADALMGAVDDLALSVRAIDGR